MKKRGLFGCGPTIFAGQRYTATWRLSRSAFSTGMKRKAKRPTFSPPTSGTTPDSAPASVGSASRAALLAQIASQVAGAITLAILYRMLSPQEYGLMAALAPWIMLPRMAATLGLGAAFVQLRDASQAMLDRLFRVQLRWGIYAVLVSAALVPVAAWLWNDSQLLPLGFILAGSTLLSALANLHLAYLEKRMQMVASAQVRIGGLLAGSLAGIGGAVAGLGVYALVLQQTVELAAILVLVYRMESWRPAWWSTEKSAKGSLHLERFGIFYSLSQLVNYAGQNLPSLLVPFLVGEAASQLLGLYGQASGWMMRIVFLVTMPLGSVTLAALSKTEVGSSQFSLLTQRFFRLTAILLFPAALGLWAVSLLLMRLLGGDAWIGAGGLLMILAPSAIGLGLMNLMTPIFSAAGQAKLLLWQTLIATLVSAQGMFAGFMLAKLQTASDTTQEVAAIQQGEGIALGFTLTTLVVITLPYLFLGLKACGVLPIPVLKGCVRPLRNSSLMAVCVWMLAGWLQKQWPAETFSIAAGELLLCVSLGVVLYWLLSREELKWAYGMLTEKNSRA